MTTTVCGNAPSVTAPAINSIDERSELGDALPLESERMVRSGQTDDHRAAVEAWLAAADAKRAPSQPAREGE